MDASLRWHDEVDTGDTASPLRTAPHAISGTTDPIPTK